MLLLTNEYLREYNNECRLSLEAYLNACDIVSNNILELLQEKQIDKDDVLLIGVARGGLPLLVGVSHRTGIRNISTIQVKMNKSDNKDDYGKAEILNFNYDNLKKYYIVFEDIIYKGQSVNLILDSLKEERKKVLSIYSLVIDEDFLNTHVFKYDLNLIKPCYRIKKDSWTYFFWEKGYRNESNN